MPLPIIRHESIVSVPPCENVLSTGHHNEVAQTPRELLQDSATYFTNKVVADIVDLATAGNENAL